MARLYKKEQQTKDPSFISASELRKLPKAERERILEQQYKLGAKMYADDPQAIIQASQRVHD